MIIEGKSDVLVKRRIFVEFMLNMILMKGTHIFYLLYYSFFVISIEEIADEFFVRLFMNVNGFCCCCYYFCLTLFT